MDSMGTYYLLAGVLIGVAGHMIYRWWIDG